MKVLLYNPESSILNRGIVMQYIPLEKKTIWQEDSIPPYLFIYNCLIDI